jgi:hypothetical protein
MSKIRKAGTRKSMRNRECYNCGQKIMKGDLYVFIDESYDGKMICTSYHHSIECAPHRFMKQESK